MPQVEVECAWSDVEVEARPSPGGEGAGQLVFSPPKSAPPGRWPVGTPDVEVPPPLFGRAVEAVVSPVDDSDKPLAREAPSTLLRRERVAVVLYALSKIGWDTAVAGVASAGVGDPAASYSSAGDDTDNVVASCAMARVDGEASAREARVPAVVNEVEVELQLSSSASSTAPASRGRRNESTPRASGATANADARAMESAYADTGANDVRCCCGCEVSAAGVALDSEPRISRAEVEVDAAAPPPLPTKSLKAMEGNGGLDSVLECTDSPGVIEAVALARSDGCRI